MSSTAVRLVPAPPAEYESTATALSSLGLIRSRAPLPEAEQSPNSEIWLTEDHRTAAVWVRDELLDVSYISVQGIESRVLAERIRSVLPMDGIPQLQARVIADRDPDVLMDSILRAAVLACSGFDPQAFTFLQWALRDPDPLVRRVALLAVSVTGWRDFSPILEEISEKDPIDEVRKQAARVLNSILRPEGDASAT
ncbi:HEAT repeat domain-containing protein [Streptomyces anulatus]|uniref:HEAT repeat domain-containing protein n=1 Tax=Streptomyces anulatus TaxID=1892 RepID=UPI0036B017FB